MTAHTLDASRVAYFSMEIALEPDIPTYSGGLGVLAGDTLRAAADASLPLVAVTLIHRGGYFIQRLDEAGVQSETDASWTPERRLRDTGVLVTIHIHAKPVLIRVWRYDVHGYSGHVIPVYLLDTNVKENGDFERSLTDRLYGGDGRYRLCQEAVLGIGGVAALSQLGHRSIDRFHMNEGHSALLVHALLSEAARGSGRSPAEDLASVRERCVFTTHTPVPAGHDRFSAELVRDVLGEDVRSALEEAGCMDNGELNMTWLALQGSRYVNGVAMLHGEVSRSMFPRHPVSAITNGVHAATWVSPPFAKLFDDQIPGWRRDNLYLRYARGISIRDIREAHSEAKRLLFASIEEKTGVRLEPRVFTIGFGRRAATYKRADLLFRTLERLRWIDNNIGPIQIIYGGKAHPADEPGKQMIREVCSAAVALQDVIPVVYVPNYDWNWGAMMTAGVDLWLNTPRRPQEASGTSGMKAAINGVPSLSVLDGWWVEGHIEGVTGWAIGHGGELAEDDATEAASLYEKLESAILPTFYGSPHAYGGIMRAAISINGSFFNTQRMVSQYVSNAYASTATASHA